MTAMIRYQMLNWVRFSINYPSRYTLGLFLHGRIMSKRCQSQHVGKTLRVSRCVPVTDVVEVGMHGALLGQSAAAVATPSQRAFRPVSQGLWPPDQCFLGTCNLAT